MGDLIRGGSRDIRSHVALARQFASWVRQDGRFELSAPTPLNLGVLSPPRGGRVQRSVAGFSQSKRRSLLNAYQAQRPLCHPLLRRPDLHRISSRGTSLGTDLRGNREAGIARGMVAQVPLGACPGVPGDLWLFEGSWSSKRLALV